LQFLEQGKKRKKNISTLNSQNSNLAEKKNSSINSIIAKKSLPSLENNNIKK